MQCSNSLRNKIRFILLVGLLVLCILPQRASAARFSGEYLINICALDRKGNEVIKGGQIACQSYLSGVIDYHNMLRSMELTSDMNFCIPSDVTLNALQLRVWLYMKRRAKMHRKFVAAPGVAMALFALYPCR